MLHRIFQRHSIPPDEVYTKDIKHRLFMYASEEIVAEEEDRQRKRKRGR